MNCGSCFICGEDFFGSETFTVVPDKICTSFFHSHSFLSQRFSLKDSLNSFSRSFDGLLFEQTCFECLALHNHDVNTSTYLWKSNLMITDSIEHRAIAISRNDVK